MKSAVQQLLKIPAHRNNVYNIMLPHYVVNSVPEIAKRKSWVKQSAMQDSTAMHASVAQIRCWKCTVLRGVARLVSPILYKIL